jgi:hypothetical protein
VVGHQPGLPLAVADLLGPVRFHARSVVMPYERGRSEADLPAPRLQPPADVHVIARSKVDWIEAADGEERVAAERHVATGHVLRETIVEQHVCRTAGCACDALRHGWIVRRHDVGTAGADDARVEERLNEEREPVAIGSYVGVGVRHDIA